jgi:signal peptidase I
MNQRWRGCLLEVVETVLLTVVIFFLVQHFVAQPYQILQVSMEHTLEPDQMVLVDKLSPVFSDYKRGDVIVFQPPAGYSEDGQDIPFIKRVVGVGGDLVEIHNDAVYVNGVKLDEPYVYDGQPTTPLTGTDPQVVAAHVCAWSVAELTCRVPSGELFVLGDHREQSTDSRIFGPIQKSSVIGRAWLRYWPLSAFSWVGSATYQGIPDVAPAPSTKPTPVRSPSR